MYLMNGPSILGTYIKIKISSEDPIHHADAIVQGLKNYAGPQGDKVSSMLNPLELIQSA